MAWQVSKCLKRSTTSVHIFIVLLSMLVVLNDAYNIASIYMNVRSLKLCPGKDNFFRDKLYLNAHSFQDGTSEFDINPSVEEDTETGVTLRGKRRKVVDNRDFLPFSIVEEPGRIQLGTFLLEPSTACGDYIDLADRGMFKVNRVIFNYKYVNGKFQVFKKTVEVITTTSPWRIDSGYTREPDSAILQ